MTPTQYRAALESLGLTQDQAAILLGVSIKTSNSWANGRHRIPKSVAIMLRLLRENRELYEKLQKSEFHNAGLRVALKWNDTAH